MNGEILRILKIDYPDDGYGIFTYVQKYKYPYNGFPNESVVNVDATFKRSLIGLFKLFFRDIWKLGPKMAVIRYIGEVAKVAFLDTSYFHLTGGSGKQVVNEFKEIKDPKRFCRSGRELYRVGKFFINKLPEDKRKDWGNLLIGLIMIWEFDNSYRFRGQDILSELNIENLKLNPKKEIIRLVGIGIEREMSAVPQEVKKEYHRQGGFDLGDKWRMLWILTSVLFFFRPSYVRFIRDLLLAINLEEIKPDESDVYWQAERTDYNFAGKTHEVRSAERKLIDDEYLKTIPPEPPEQPKLVLMPNEQWFMLNKENAEKVVNDLLKQVWAGYEVKHKQYDTTSQ